MTLEDFLDYIDELEKRGDAHTMEAIRTHVEHALESQLVDNL